MDIFTGSFFGHRCIDNPISVEQKLQELIGSLLQNKSYVEFLVGRDGDFDQLASSVIRRCKRTIRDDNCAHVWVLPYMTAEFLNNEEAYRAYYDDIEVCYASSSGHFKNAHRVRNREMVDRSDLVIFCIQHENGGAYQTMRYAQKQGKPYIDLSKEVNS